MNRDAYDRRTFLAAAAAGASAASVGFVCAGVQAKPQAAAGSQTELWVIREGPNIVPDSPVVISSANGLRTVEKAMTMIRAGDDPLDAVVAGINIVEDDPTDNSVGYGGLPNEKGVVELDASVMHGPSHKAGAVAALQNIKNPSSVALQVLRRTDHVLLVGGGALEFARAHGFEEMNLLTAESREAWLKWKENLNREDDWLDRDQRIAPPHNAPPASQPQQQSRRGTLTPALSLSTASLRLEKGEGDGIPYTHGTIHCAAVNADGDLSACTSTSGLSYKLPGRVGDSPIIGAGMYVDNGVGAAGATGRGEAVIQACGAFAVVRHMAEGLEPAEACLKVLKWIADHNRQDYLRNEKGEPNFGVTLYALRKDGAYGSATMRAQKDRPNANQFAVHDGTSARLVDCVALFDQ